MALESATYIDDLNVSNPAASDAVGQADDHIRMLKAVLKNTFPNIDGQVTATPLQLNQGTVPIGLIAMWSGSPASLPTGWRLCDGGTYTRSDGGGNITAPDLRDVFIKGCGGSTASPSAAPTVGTTGGAKTHTHTLTINGTSLTQAQLPSCNFTVSDPGHNHTATSSDSGHSHTYNAGASQVVLYGTVPTGAGGWGGVQNAGTGYANITTTVASNTTGISVSSGGSGDTHTHTHSLSTDNHEPQFYTLAFIIKI